MKKIAVVLTQPIDYSTSSMIRCRNIINEYPKLGWSVICFSPYPDQHNIYYDGQINLNPDITVKRYGKKRIGNTVIGAENVLKKKLYTFFRGLYKKVDLFGSSIKYVKYKKEICNYIKLENCNLLLSFSDPKPAHIIAGYCKRHIKGIKYIQQWGDPLTLDITSKTILPKWYRHNVEAALLWPADRVCYVSPITFEEQKRVFKGKSDDIIFLPTPCEEHRYESGKKSRIKVGYFGSYNLVARDIRIFYNTACLLTDCDFVFVGDSDVELQPKANIEIIDRVTPKDLEEYILDVDVLVCLMNKRGTQIPGKIYNYAGTNKEVLVIKDGECGDEIEAFFAKYNRYTFVENKESKIFEVISNYIHNGVPERAPLKEFSPNVVAAKLIDGLVE